MFILALAVSAAFPAAAGAADTEVATLGETEGFGKGHVYVRAVVEEGYETDITACLIPVSESGTVREYLLNAENRYGLSDDITEGTYICVPFITDPLQDNAVYVEYGGTEKEVRQVKDTAFVVVAGSAGFVRDCIWISGYRDENGEPLKGVVSRREAEAAFVETVAAQREQTEEPADPALSFPEEVTADGEAPETAAPLPEQETGTGEKRDVPTALPALVAVCLAVSAAIWYVRKRH